MLSIGHRIPNNGIIELPYSPFFGVPYLAFIDKWQIDIERNAYIYFAIIHGSPCNFIRRFPAKLKYVMKMPFRHFIHGCGLIFSSY